MKKEYNKLKPTEKGTVAEDFGKAAARHLLMQLDWLKEFPKHEIKRLKKEHLKRKHKLPPEWAKKKDAAIQIIIKDEA